MDQKDHELTGNLARVHEEVLQSGAKGIRAVQIARELRIDKTTVHAHLNTLKLKGLVESDQGTWSARTGDRTTKSLEKEIVIELPLPKKDWQRMALLEDMAQVFH